MSISGICLIISIVSAMIYTGNSTMVREAIDGINDRVHILEEKRIVYLEEDVTGTSGRVIKVHTDRLRDGEGVYETLDAWYARHDAAVDVAKTK